MEGWGPKQGEKIEVEVSGEWLECVFVLGPNCESLAAKEGGGEIWNSGVSARPLQPGSDSPWACPVCRETQSDPVVSEQVCEYKFVDDKQHAHVLKEIEKNLRVARDTFLDDRMSSAANSAPIRHHASSI